MRILSGLLIALPLMLQQPGFFGGNFSTAAPAPTYNATGSGTNGAASTTASVTVTTLAGDASYLGLNWNSTATMTALTLDGVSITANNIYTSHPFVWATSRSFDLFAVPNMTAGSHTFQVTLGTSATVSMAVLTATGASTTTPTNAFSTPIAIGAATNPFSCNTLTTTSDNTLIFTWAGTTSSGVATGAPAGWTKPYAWTSFPGYSTLYRQVTTASTYTPTATTTSTLPAWCAAVAVR